MPRAGDRTALADQSGSVTIEAAVGVACLVIVFTALVGGAVTLANYLAAVDAAGAAARAHAIGAEGVQFDRGSLTVRESGGVVTATATVGAPFGELTARAAYPVEYR
ncbi:hypothetical protein [Corynebacterium frankenforstense]